jgi:hypothetical protein
MAQAKIKIPTKTNPVSSAPAQAGSDAAPESGPQAAPAPEAPAPEALKPLSKEEKRALFDKAFAYDETVAALEKQIEQVKAEKSIAVEAVKNACGKGPFQYRGREITISSREGTFFFKDYGKRDLETVD